MPSAINGDSLYFPRSFVCENELDSVWKLRVTSYCKLKKERKKEKIAITRPSALDFFSHPSSRALSLIYDTAFVKGQEREHTWRSPSKKIKLIYLSAMPSPLPSLVGVYRRVSYAVRVSGRRYATLFSVILSQPPTRLPSGGASRCAGSNRCSSRRLEFLCHARVSLSFSRLFLSNPARDSCCNCNIRTPRRGFHSRTPVKACPTSSSESVKRQTARKVISAFFPPSPLFLPLFVFRGNRRFYFTPSGKSLEETLLSIISSVFISLLFQRNS